MLKVIFSFLLALPSPSWAHGHDGDEDAAIRHFARIVELAPKVLVENSVTVPYVTVSGQKIYMNGPFWELVQGWTRLYYRELQRECDSCMDWSEEQFAQAARDQMAKSFLQVKVTEPLLHGAEHIAVGTADIGSQLGKTAAVAKVAAEVAETGVSKLIGGGGVHLICHVLDAIILFATRHIQTATRAFSWSGRFDRSALATWVKMAFVSSVVRRAQKKVSFAVGPVTVDEAELKELDAEGPNRWWGWIDSGKRARWLKRLAAARKPLSLAKDEFLGSRMKRYLWLKGRKRGHSTYMKGQGEMDAALSGNVLWILAVQENMVERAFQSDGEAPEKALSLADSRTPAYDEVRSGIAGEFAQSPEQQQLFDSLFRDVDVIFQADVPSRVRYFHAARLETMLAGFMYGRFLASLTERGEVFSASLSGIYNQVQLHWRAGRFGSYLLEWSDFLRLAALQTDPERLMKHRYEAMEALARALQQFRLAGALAEIERPDQLLAFADQMSDGYRNLATFVPWREKRTTYSWRPWRRPTPTCEAMNEKAL